MRRMLIVDDEPDICECLKDFFSGRGFEVQMVFSGEEALEKLHQEELDVVVLDIMLPGISGLEVLRRAKEMRPDARVIIMTGLPSRDLRESTRWQGARGFVAKPFDFTEETWAPVFVEPPHLI